MWRCEKNVCFTYACSIQKLFIDSWNILLQYVGKSLMNSRFRADILTTERSICVSLQVWTERSMHIYRVSHWKMHGNQAQNTQVWKPCPDLLRTPCCCESSSMDVHAFCSYLEWSTHALFSQDVCAEASSCCYPVSLTPTTHPPFKLSHIAPWCL